MVDFKVVIRLICINLSGENVVLEEVRVLVVGNSSCVIESRNGLGEEERGGR